MYCMPITIGFIFHENESFIFLLFLMGKIGLVYVLFGKSPELERIKDVYRGSTVIVIIIIVIISNNTNTNTNTNTNNNSNDNNSNNNNNNTNNNNNNNSNDNNSKL